MTSEVWHIVVVDDSPDDCAEARRMLLKGSDRHYAFTEAATGAAGIRAAQQYAAAQHRCIVLDYNLPDMTAAAFLAAISGSEGTPDWPVVVFTGGDSAEASRSSLRAGAHDYVGKSWMTPQVLVRAVENASERWAMARELQQQTAAAQASAQHFQALAQATSDTVYRMSADWSAMRPMNGGALVSSTDTPLQDWTWLDRNVPADEHARVRQAIGVSIAQKALFSLEHRVLRPDGSIGWAESRAVPIFDAHGNVLEWFGAAADITQRKAAEDTVRASEERFRLAAEAVDGIIYDVDLATHQVVRTRGLFSVVGHQPDEVPSTVEWWRDQIHPDDVPTASIQAVAAASAHSVYGYRVRHKDGRWLHVEDRSVRVCDEAGKLTRLVGCTTDVTAQVEAAMALRHSENFLQRVAAIVPGVLRVFDLAAGRTLFINRSVASLLGFTPEQIEAMGTEVLLTLMHPQDVPRFEAHLARMRTLAEGDVAEFEHRLRDRAGAWHWFHTCDAVFERDEAGAVQQIIGVATDITARKDAEAALARSEAFARSVVGANADCMKRLSLDGRLLWMNDNGQRLMELGDFAALQGTDWASLWQAGGLRPQAESAMATARAGGTGRFTGPCPTAAGTPRWWDVAVTAIPGHDGRTEQLLAVSRDVTEQRAADEATRALAERLQLALDCSNVVLFQQDLDLRYTWIYNPVLGFEAAQVVGQRDADLMERAADAEFVVALKQDVLRTGVGQRHEAVIHHLGVAHHYRLLVEPLRDAAGTVTGVTCAAIDITELKQAQQALVERDVQKDEFLATLAHELRNPLAPLRTGVQVLKMAPEPHVAQRTQLMMERQMRHMVRLIDDLLDVSRITRGKVALRLARTELQAAIHTAVEAVQPLLDTAAQTMRLDMPAEPIWLQADDTRISQVVSNLLTNASKYSPRGSAIMLGVQRAGSDAVVTVADPGEGIPQDMLTQIFQMFTQVDRTLERAQGGLGIGLALVKRLAEMHGGTVSAASAGLGAGSTFTLRLPALDEAQGPDNPEATAEELAASTRLRLLVVDDNVDAADTLAELLTLYGHETRVADSGLAALAMAREFKPALVFMDIGMPGMNGHETARRIRADDPSGSVTLVALTGWGAEADRIKAREAGFDHHFTKPIELGKVEGVLQQVALRQAGTRSAPSAKP